MTERWTTQPRGGDTSKVLQTGSLGANSDTSTGGSPSGGQGEDVGVDNSAEKSLECPATQFARAMPVMLLKLESRACGLLAAWVRDVVILVNVLSKAEAM